MDSFSVSVTDCKAMLFRTSTPSWNLTRLNPLGIPADSPVSVVQQADTQLDTNPPQFEGDTELWKTGISPGGKFSKSTV